MAVYQRNLNLGRETTGGLSKAGSDDDACEEKGPPWARSTPVISFQQWCFIKCSPPIGAVAINRAVLE